MGAVGSVIVTLAVVVQLLASDTVTIYVPAVKFMAVLESKPVLWLQE